MYLCIASGHQKPMDNKNKKKKMKRKTLIGQDWRKERNEFCVVERGL